MVSRVTQTEAAAKAGQGAQEPVADAAFRDLAAIASNLDAGRKPDEAAPAPQLTADGAPQIPPEVAALAAELYAMLTVPRDLFAEQFSYWPAYGKVWSDDQLRTIASTFAALAESQGWSAADLLGRYGPMLAFGVAVGLPSFATWKVTQLRKAQLAEHRKRQVAAAPAAAPTAPAANDGGA